jgi:predicted nucleic acid-binding Zn ribbon protein
MDTAAILIGLVLFGIAILFIARPFQPKQAKKTRHFIATDNGEERIAVLSALRDLDFDHKIGKVSDDDYGPTRELLLVDAARYMEQQDEKDTMLEELIQKRRVSKGEICTECGSPMESGQRFCSECGSQMPHADCPSCGKKVRAGDLFCSSCGTKLQACTEQGQSVKMETVHQ